MRELFDDFNDIEFDDNEIIERLMREMEEEERRQTAAGPARKRRYSFDRPVDDNDPDEEYDDELDEDDDDDDDDDDYDDDYDDFDDDRY